MGSGPGGECDEHVHLSGDVDLSNLTVPVQALCLSVRSDHWQLLPNFVGSPIAPRSTTVKARSLSNRMRSRSVPAYVG